MRVLFATDHYYPYPGGITEHAYHLSKELMKLGVHVEVLTSNFTKEFIKAPEDASIIPVHRVGRSVYIRANKSQTCFSFSKRIVSEVKDIIQRGNYDIVHSQNSVVPTIPYLSLLYAEGKRFATFHSYHGFSLGYELFKPLFLPVYEKLDGKIFVSRPALITISRHFEVKDYRIIPNGVDIEKFNPEGPLFELPFKRSDDIVILFVGRLEVRKGTRYLIEAFNLIAPKDPRLKLVIAGDGPLRRKLESLVLPELKDRVFFLGFVSGSDLPSLYRSSDIFVSPAITGESFGIVLLEAMASGKAIIAFDNEGYREVLDDGQEGFLVKRKDVKKLAEKIALLAEDGALRIRMGELGRKKSLNYAWPSIAQKVLEYYKSVL